MKNQGKSEKLIDIYNCPGVPISFQGGDLTFGPWYVPELFSTTYFRYFSPVTRLIHSSLLLFVCKVRLPCFRPLITEVKFHKVL